MRCTAVAGIFGTEFIKIEDGPGHHISVSQDFWLLWLIAVPLTVVVVVIWRVWYADAKGRLVGEIPREAKRYLGWKTLRRTLLSPSEDKTAPYNIDVREVSTGSRGLAGQDAG
jgi:hypothetical protein